MINSLAAPGYRLRLIMCLALLSPAACEKHDTAYFPLSEGHTWYYSIERRTVEGIGRQKEIIQSLDSFREGDSKAVTLKSISGLVARYQESATGIRRLHIESPGGKRGASGNMQTILTYPLETGTRWQDVMLTTTLTSHDRHAHSVIEAIPVEVAITSTSDTVRVAAGTFRDCLRVESRGEKLVQKGKYAYQDTMIVSLENTRWYAAGVGLVKEEHSEQSSILEYPRSGYLKTLDRFRP